MQDIQTYRGHYDHHATALERPGRCLRLVLIRQVQMLIRSTRGVQASTQR
jgi:hypothetical protein